MTYLIGAVFGVIGALFCIALGMALQRMIDKGDDKK